MVINEDVWFEVCTCADSYRVMTDDHVVVVDAEVAVVCNVRAFSLLNLASAVDSDGAPDIDFRSLVEVANLSG